MIQLVWLFYKVKKINTVKDKGRISNLEMILNTKDLTGNTDIAHTRWATHGIPSKENAHPHNSQNLLLLPMYLNLLLLERQIILFILMLDQKLLLPQQKLISRKLVC